MAFRKNRKSQASENISPEQSAYRPAYTPGSQGKVANNVFHNHQGATQYSRQNPVYATQSARKSKRGRNIALGVVAAVLVVAVGCGAAFAVWYNNVSKELNQGSYTEEQVEEINDQLVTASYTEPFYVLLIGSDKRADGDDADGARSDTNIVVRVDPVNNQATLVSIPRDTMIDIDGYGTNKFNAAYNYGGAAATIREATQLTGVGISHYVEVGFDDLIALVDAVGGVDVQVDELVDDPDADGTASNPDWEHVVIEPGLQHLSGNAALTFARSRAYADGDFTRTSNQRKLIEALVDKVLALPVTEMPAVIQAAAKCVTTDMKITDILSLAQQIKGNNNGELTLYSAMLPSITGYVDGVSYVFADEDAMAKMMKIVDEGGDPSGITGTTSKLAQEKMSSSSSTGSSSGSTGISTSGSGQYAGNDYDTGGGVGGVYSNYGSTSTYSDTSSSSSSGGYAGSSYNYSSSSYSGSSSGYDSGYSSGSSTYSGGSSTYGGDSTYSGTSTYSDTSTGTSGTSGTTSGGTGATGTYGTGTGY